MTGTITLYPQNPFRWYVVCYVFGKYAMHSCHISRTMLFPASTWIVTYHVKQTRKAVHGTLLSCAHKSLCPYKVASFKDILTNNYSYVRN